jgi:hypothetical protein
MNITAVGDYPWPDEITGVGLVGGPGGPVHVVFRDREGKWLYPSDFWFEEGPDVGEPHTLFWIRT